MQKHPVYSTLFSTLYDEQEPVGSLGRGTHYSVLRSVEWLDVTREPLQKPQIHDFSVIWDEDHDTRVIDAIERIYMAGLLSPVQFIGERKGTLTVIVAARYYFWGDEKKIADYHNSIEAIINTFGDPWPVNIGMFDRAPGPFNHQCDPEGIINAPEHNVMLYLKNIDSLWSLGTKEYSPSICLYPESDLITPPIPVVEVNKT